MVVEVVEEVDVDVVELVEVDVVVVVGTPVVVVEVVEVVVAGGQSTAHIPSSIPPQGFPPKQ